MLGIISKRPWEAVKVVHNAPAPNEPWIEPATPASDCIWEMTGMEPQMFSCLAVALASESAAIGEDGVMG